MLKIPSMLYGAVMWQKQEIQVFLCAYSWDFGLLLIIIIIPIYCWFTFLLSFPCLPLSSHLKLTFCYSFLWHLCYLLSHMPTQFIQPYSTLDCFLFFRHLPFKFLKHDFKYCLTKKISIFNYDLKATFLLSLQVICTMQHFVMTLTKQ